MLYHRAIWRYIDTSPYNNDIVIVYRGKGRIHNKDRERFRVDQPETGVFDLVISKVKVLDSGIYCCRESSGPRQGAACTELIVTGEVHHHHLFAQNKTRSSATAEKQRVSCPHRGRRGLGPPAHSPSAPSGYTYAYGRIRKPQRTYVKCAVRKVHFKMNRVFKVFKVILTGAGRNPEWSVVLMCN